MEEGARGEGKGIGASCGRGLPGAGPAGGGAESPEVAPGPEGSPGGDVTA